MELGERVHFKKARSIRQLLQRQNKLEENYILVAAIL